MKKLLEKIFKRIENYVACVDNTNFKAGLLSAEDIIKQEVEQYNNGWNRIEDGKPPAGKPLIVTIKDHMQGRPNELRYPVYYEKDSMRGGYHWSWRYGDIAYELLPDVSEVIAWQPLPEPYQPKGE